MIIFPNKNQATGRWAEKRVQFNFIVTLKIELSLKKKQPLPQIYYLQYPIFLFLVVLYIKFRVFSSLRQE